MFSVPAIRAPQGRRLQQSLAATGSKSPNREDGANDSENHVGGATATHGFAKSGTFSSAKSALGLLFLDALWWSGIKEP